MNSSGYRFCSIGSRLLNRSQLCFYFVLPGVLCDVQCGTKISVIGVEGEDIVLRVDKVGFSEISWTLKGTHFATTKPNRTIEVKTLRMKHRLASEPDCSLTVTKLSHQDQGVYFASLIGTPDEDIITQLQDGDMTVHPRLFRNKVCDIELSCTVNGEATIEWLDYNKTIMESSNLTIRIYNVTSNLPYTCMANNSVSEIYREVYPLTYCKK
ncbi:hypothetical protein GDO86_016644, partial [Hymenochirus boettgeri]